MTITGLSKRMHAQALERGDTSVLASAGVARSAAQVRVVDDEDQELPAGEPGEVVTRGACVMQGYWRDPDANAGALRGGWLHTGDVGCMDERGFLALKDRSKDLIISGCESSCAMWRAVRAKAQTNARALLGKCWRRTETASF